MKPWRIAVIVFVGLIAGAAWPGALANALRAATLYVFLPALIFEAAWNLDPREMLRGWRPIVLLVFPGVVLTAVLVAIGAHVFGGLPVALALLLGAILSATDPVAVVAIFRHLRVPHALTTIVESEALLNDAVAFAIYRAVLAGLIGAASFANTGTIVLHTFLGVIFAVSLGIIGGFLFGQVLRLRDNVAAQTIVTFIAAYAVYFVADRLGWSGIFSVIACAITMREYARRSAALQTAEGVEHIWDICTLAANVVLFFLIGAAVEPRHLLGEWRLLAATLVAVVIARVVLAYGLLALVPRLERSWKLVVQLAGVRGALALALAIALPRQLLGSNIVIDATFVIVLITIIASTLTVERHIQTLDLT